MNQVVISGKVWEPEVRYTQSGMAVCEVSLSVYDGKDKDGKAKYFNIKCKAFKELAENTGNSVQKGDNVIACGHLTQEQWEKDGQTQRRIVMIVDSIAKEVSRFSD